MKDHIKRFEAIGHAMEDRLDQSDGDEDMEDHWENDEL